MPLIIIIIIIINQAESGNPAKTVAAARFQPESETNSGKFDPA